MENKNRKQKLSFLCHLAHKTVRIPFIVVASFSALPADDSVRGDVGGTPKLKCFSSGGIVGVVWQWQS
jgi:hypothetical protein